MGMSTVSVALVAHMSALANIPVTKLEEEKLAQGFATTLKVVDQLMDIDTSSVQPTHQVTGLMNVWREDSVDESRTFSQAEALANASNKHNGYFVVPQLVGE